MSVCWFAFVTCCFPLLLDLLVGYACFALWELFCGLILWLVVVVKTSFDRLAVLFD